MHHFALAGLGVFCFMLLMFVIAQIIKNNSIADIGWGLGFILIVFLTLPEHTHLTRKHKLMEFLIIVWGLRLSSYVGIRNWGQPEDFRYANWRKEWGKNAVWRAFLQVFMLQGVIMYLIALPILVVNSNYGGNQFGNKWLYAAGAGIWFVGFFFEALADHQMYFFKNDPHKKGKVMNQGLWRYSRHPNYFGECLMWWGIFVVAIPSGMWYVSIISPLLITYLLLKVSGVTMLEKKYTGNTAYDLYKQQTNAFIPWLPKKQTES